MFLISKNSTDEKEGRKVFLNYKLTLELLLTFYFYISVERKSKYTLPLPFLFHE